MHCVERKRELFQSDASYVRYVGSGEQIVSDAQLIFCIKFFFYFTELKELTGLYGIWKRPTSNTSEGEFANESRPPFLYPPISILLPIFAFRCCRSNSTKYECIVEKTRLNIKENPARKLMLYNLWSVITRERLSPPSSFDCWYGTRRKRPGRFVRLFGFSLLYRNDSPVLVVNDSWFWRSTRLLSNPFSVFCFLGCCCLVFFFTLTHSLQYCLTSG